MVKKRYIQLKAGVLLFIFALNTVVGFACSLNVDMGFNTMHHHDEGAPKIHIHADGKKHVHKKKEHAHEESGDNCCKDKVREIAQSDKTVPQPAIHSAPPSFICLDAYFYTCNVPLVTQAKPSNKYFVRGHHPPIDDIRIVISSFQI